MAIIHQHDKRSGITYAYESHSYWDKENMNMSRLAITTKSDIIYTSGFQKHGKPSHLLA